MMPFGISSMENKLSLTMVLDSLLSLASSSPASTAINSPHHQPPTKEPSLSIITHCQPSPAILNHYSPQLFTIIATISFINRGQQASWGTGGPPAVATAATQRAPSGDCDALGTWKPSAAPGLERSAPAIDSRSRTKCLGSGWQMVGRWLVNGW